MIKIFNDRQLERLSDITSNLGLVFFTSIVIPIFTENGFNFLVFLVGLASSLGFWITSLIILKEVKNE